MSEVIIPDRLSKRQKQEIKGIISDHEEILLSLKGANVVSLSAYREVKNVIEYGKLLLKQDFERK